MEKTILSAGILALAGCASIPHNEGEPAKVSTVVEQIKADLGEYQKYDAFVATKPPLKNACGGAIGFQIESVKVSLTTQSDDTVAANASAELPVGTGTFGFNMGGSQERKGTQNLTFNLYPRPVELVAGSQEPVLDPAKFPIAASLQRLRNGLLEASGNKPCFSLVPLGTDGKPAGKDDGATYEIGFAVINTGTAGASLKFVVFSLGATRTTQRMAGNTITATFKARPETGAAFRPL